MCRWISLGAATIFAVTLCSAAGCSSSSSQPTDAGSAADTSATPGDAGGSSDAGTSTAADANGSDVSTPGDVSGGDATASPVRTARSDLERDTNPQVSDQDLEAVESGARAFALDLYHQLASTSDGNVFLSPHSISVALAMTWAGARGETESQMADVLHFPLPQDLFHPAMNALDLELASRETQATQNEATFSLRVANALWGQTGWDFLQDFLDTLALNYGAGMQLLDFAADPEAARKTINDWVADRTEQKIEDLLPPGSIDDATRLVLTNAIYFLAQWAEPFDPANTQDGPFTRLDGSQVTVPVMHGSMRAGYAEGNGWKAARLPYAGVPLSMWMVVPDEGQFETVDAAWDSTSLDDLANSFGEVELTLDLPKFSFTWGGGLAQPLEALGLTAPFDPTQADFSGMDGRKDLFVTGVFHKAFIAVDEAGTEAAAATAVVIGETSVPPSVHLTVDRPFLFFVVDEPTGTILFEGRLVDPSQS